MVVRPRYLRNFLAWQLHRTLGPAARLRRLTAMTLGWRAGARGIDSSRLQHLIDRPGASWMQYSSDGSRMLVVDLARGEAVRFQLNVDPALVERELFIRARAGSAAPRVLYHDAAAGMIVERWMELRPAPVGREILGQAIRLLAATVYAPKAMNAAEYLRDFTAVVHVERTQAFLDALGLREVMVTEVHGDLWPGNIATDWNGELVLLDWEYARRCVQTHDLWTFLMQDRRQRGRPFNKEFLGDFATQHGVLFGGATDERLAKAHHLLHLIERYSLFAQLKLPHKAEEMGFLRGEIAAVSPELPL